LRQQMPNAGPAGSCNGHPETARRERNRLLRLGEQQRRRSLTSLLVRTNSSGAAARARPLHRPGIGQVDELAARAAGSSQLVCEAKQQRPLTASCLLRLAAAAVSKRRR